MSVDSLSVFFPAYNEEKNIADVVKKAVKVLEEIKLSWEVLIVNDGSKDKTKQVAEKLVEEDPKHIRLIDQANGGYGAALKAGYANAKYQWIVYTDADGQFDFKEINKFLEKAPEADLLLGYRIKRNDPFLRLLFAKGWKLTIWLFFGIAVRDVDCGFKMVKKSVIDKISPLESNRGGMINAELTIKTKKAGFKIAQVGVNHYPRTAGKPTGANIKVIISSYLDMLKLWWKLK